MEEQVEEQVQVKEVKVEEQGEEQEVQVGPPGPVLGSIAGLKLPLPAEHVHRVLHHVLALVGVHEPGKVDRLSGGQVDRSLSGQVDRWTGGQVDRC